MGKYGKNMFSEYESPAAIGRPFALFNDDGESAIETLYGTLCEEAKASGFSDDIYGSIKKIAVRSYKKGMSLKDIKGVKKDIERVKRFLSVENSESAIIISAVVAFRFYTSVSDSVSLFKFLGVSGLDRLRYEQYLTELSLNGAVWFSDYMRSNVCASEYLISALSNGTPIKTVDFKNDSYESCVSGITRVIRSSKELGIGVKAANDFISDKISSGRFKSFSMVCSVIKDNSIDFNERMFSGYIALICVEWMIKRGSSKFAIEDLCNVDGNIMREYECESNAWRKLNLKKESNFLTESGLFSHAFLNGQKLYDTYAFSDAFNEALHNDDPFLPAESDDSKETMENVISCHDITPKEMYYNDGESKKIGRLEEILDNENFIGLQEKLSGKGMRKGFTCIFYGSPGTGKTETVYQLARKTGRDIIRVNVSELKSCWVGESEKNYSALFDDYRMACSKSPKVPILLFNEADAIFSKRSDDVSRAVDKMENSLQNILLEGMEKMEGILIATTNLTENFDSAFDRRFLYKVEFKKPCEKAKASIWKSMLPELTDAEAKELSIKYDFSGGQIENIARKKVVDDVLNGNGCKFEDILGFCDDELSIKRNSRSVVAGFR